MKLLVNELISELKQTISGDKISIVEGIRLHLYKHRNPAGTLYLDVRKGRQTIASSAGVQISAISDAPFFHGQVLFEIKAHLRAGTAYDLVLRHEGYAFTEEAYVGWCLDFDFRTYPKIGKFAQDYEIWALNKSR